MDKKGIQDALNSIAKNYGEGSVYGLDDTTLGILDRWSTGVEQLDNMLGGGFAKGRIYEIYGGESAGKTSLAYHLLAQHELAVDIPIEGTLDIDRAKLFGNTDGQLIIRNCMTAEETFETIDLLAEKGIPIIVVDSVAFMITQKQFDEKDYEKDVQPARLASLMSQRLPKTQKICEKSGTTLVFINQLRDKMNASFFTADDHTPGGRTLKFVASARLQVARREWIQVPNKNPKISSDKVPVGMIMKVKLKKSKISFPNTECTIPYFFDRGFVSLDDVDSIRKEIMAENNRKLKDGEY